MIVVQHSSEFLTEKQEFALRRLEQLTELRRAARVSWATYVRLGLCLAGAIGSYYWASRSAPPLPHPNFVGIALIIWFAGIAFWQLVISPMQRRIDALTKLLEDELHRRH